MKRRANGEGSIYQRSSDKRWVVHFPMPGRIKPVVKYCKTEQDAVNTLHDLITAYKTETYIDVNNITVSEWLQRWMPIYVMDEVSNNTYARKSDLIRIHIDPEFGKIRLQQLIASDIKLFYKKLLKSGKKVTTKDEKGNSVVSYQGLAPQTVKHIHNILRPALAQAVEEGLIHKDKNPIAKIKPPKIVKTRKVRTLSEEEIGRYLNVLVNHRLYALFVLSLCTGMRRGELLGLKWTDIEYKVYHNKTTAIISIARQVQRIQNINEAGSSLEYSQLKTENSIRFIMLPACAITELQAHKNRQDKEKELAGPGYKDEGLVFSTSLGKKLDPRRIYEMHCRGLSEANIEHTAFHNLRHTVATLLLEKGENIKTIQELLGHADVSTTLNTYGHVLERMRAASAERLNGIIGSVLPTSNIIESVDGGEKQPSEFS